MGRVRTRRRRLVRRCQDKLLGLYVPMVFRCPFCGFPVTDGETTDVGVGFMKIGPDGCGRCGALEMSSYDPCWAVDAEEKHAHWRKGEGHEFIGKGSTSQRRRRSWRRARSFFHAQSPKT